MLLAAGALAGVLAFVLRELVDAQSVRAAAGMKVDGTTPAYPVVLLAVATTVLLVIGPYLLRPARRLLFAAVAIASIAAVFALVGLPDDVVASVALGWGVAAMFHLATGTPAGDAVARPDRAGDLGPRCRGIGSSTDRRPGMGRDPARCGRARRKRRLDRGHRSRRRRRPADREALAFGLVQGFGSDGLTHAHAAVGAPRLPLAPCRTRGRAGQ